MSIDVCIEPGNIFHKKLTLSELLSDKPAQLMVISFTDLDKSFWYFYNNELKADLDGAQAYATLRNECH